MPRLRRVARERPWVANVPGFPPAASVRAGLEIRFAGIPASLQIWFTLWMWTRQPRGRMARIARKTKRYPSDLTDEEKARIAPLTPKPGRRGDRARSSFARSSTRFAILRRRRLRPAQVDGQSRLSGFRPRNNLSPRQSEGRRSPATSLGRRTHFRLGDPTAQARPKLRAPHRRLERHDPRCNGRPPCPPECSSVKFQTGSYRGSALAIRGRPDHRI